MASYMRSLTRKSTLLKRPYQTTLSYALHHRIASGSDNGSGQHSAPQASNFTSVGQIGYYHSSGNFKNNEYPRSPYRFSRYMSTEVESANNASEGSGDEEVLSDLAIVVGDNVAAGEVAIAAADSFFPVAMLQHLLDAVHIHTGFSWWVSIAVTTVIIRTATLPLLIKQLIVTSKFTLLRPRFEDIRKEMEEKEMDPTAITEGRKKMMAVLKEYGVNPLTLFMGAFIQTPIFISFFCAIRNMAEKVPSLKTGGALWFMDLTTPDSLYILPVFTALSILITVECNMQEGLEGNPIAGSMKNIFRLFAIASIPITIGFPKALFCYWITSNLFSLSYGLALKVPGVKKTLGIPELATSEPSSDSRDP